MCHSLDQGLVHTHTRTHTFLSLCVSLSLCLSLSLSLFSLSVSVCLSLSLSLSVFLSPPPLPSLSVSHTHTHTYTGVHRRNGPTSTSLCTNNTQAQVYKLYEQQYNTLRLMGNFQVECFKRAVCSRAQHPVTTRQNRRTCAAAASPRAEERVSRALQEEPPREAGAMTRDIPDGAG